MIVYGGIDPGKRGAFAIIRGDGSIYVCPLASADLKELLLNFSSKHHRLCLERVHAMPKQGVTSTFTFGEQYGYIKGLLDAYGISYQEIPPERWKREFGLNTDKRKSIEVCKQLFPSVSLRPTDRSKVDDNNMAEACLMAEYARRHL